MTLITLGHRAFGGRIASPAISISPNDDTVSVLPTGTVDIIYTLTRIGGYTGTVTPAVTGLPTGVTGAWSDASLSGADTTTTLTLTATAAAEVTADAFTVTFSGSGVSDAVDVGAVTVAAVTHYGTATLPTTTPAYTSSNSGGTGHTFNPTTPAELNTVLTGGSLGGFTLSAGDTIVVLRGTCYNNGTYTSHVLPAVTGADTNPCFLITSDFASIAAPDERILESQRHATPHFRCQSGNTPALAVAPFAKGWRLKGIQADAGTTTSMYGIVTIGPIGQGSYSAATTYPINYRVYGGWRSLQNGNVGHALVEGAWWTKMTLADLPDDIVLDRCDIAATLHTNNCVVVLYCNTRELIIKGSHLWTEGGAGLEDKAVAAVDCAGPWLFENTQFTASGINLLTGGADPSFDVLPEDITIRRCYFYKPLRFISDNAAWDSKSRIHKNLFEFKVVRRALVEDCLFENHFDGGTAQYFGIVFKCSNQDGSFNNAETADVTFRYNRLKNISGVFSLYAVDLYSGGTALGMHDVSIYQNYTETLAGILNSGTDSRCWLFQVTYGTTPAPYNLHIEHNTLVGDPNQDIRTFMLAGTVGPAYPAGFVWRNNITSYGDRTYVGIQKDGVGEVGKSAFSGIGSDIQAAYMHNNASKTVPSSGIYSEPPMYFKTVDTDLFVDFNGGDYTTAAALANVGYNGETPGADITTIDTRTAGCVGGIW